MPPLITRIEIRSDLSQLADRFDLPRVGTDWFTAAVRHKPVEISLGYQGQTLHQLTGEADEYELAWNHLRLVGGLRGRDLGARLVDRHFKKAYFTTQPVPPPTFAFSVGIFTARQIANEIAAAVGLDLRWNAPDYGIQERAFSVTGPAGESVRRLVAVIGQPEMFVVDVYVDKTELVVSQRVGIPTAADYRLTNAELMNTQISYRKHPGPIYGRLTIIGGTKGGPIIETDDEDIPTEVTTTEVNETAGVPGIKTRARTTTTKTVLQSVANEVLLRETSVTEAEFLPQQPGITATPVLSGHTTVKDAPTALDPQLSEFHFTIGAAGLPDNHFNGYYIRMEGQSRRISSYDAATRTAHLESPFVGPRTTAFFGPYTGPLGDLEPGPDYEVYPGPPPTFESPAPQPPDPPAPTPAPQPFVGWLRVAETRKTIGYDSSKLLDSSGRIGIPLKLQERTEVSAIGASMGDFLRVRRETTTYAYNDDLELILQDTLVEELEDQTETKDPMGFSRFTGGHLEPVERKIIRNQRLDANQYQITTQIFEVTRVKGSKGATTRTVITDFILKLVATDVKLTRGQLPGPQRIRRPRRKQIGAGGGSSNKVLKEITISADPDAVDVLINDPNVDQALADRLVAQYQAASGLWRHEATIRNLALPFLRPGLILEWAEALPGLAAPFPKGLITSRTLEYDESGEDPSFQSTLGLVWWGPDNVA